jgi:peptidoglycan hydrolase-like protein with peptidoglycan-binding domain
LALKEHGGDQSDTSGSAEAGGPGPPTEYAALSQQLRRQRRLLLLAGTVAVLAVAGLVASHWVKSPAQVAADSAPPAPTLITASVSHEILQNTVVFRGTFTHGRTLRFTPAAEVAPSGSGPPAQSLVVSAVRGRVGERVLPGEVLVEVSDRPLFVLAGKVPAFRDMAQGDSGQDIAELQAALSGLGYGLGSDRAGIFGAGTAEAVRRFYATIGFDVPRATSAGSGSPSAQSGSSVRSGRTSRLVEVPMSEVMFVPSFPASLTAIPSHVGEQVTSPLISVALGQPELIGHLDPTVTGAVRRGMRVQVLSDTTGRRATGVVVSVGQVVTTGLGNATPYLPVRIRPIRPWASSWAGQDVRLTVTARVTSGPVLAVPEAAIFSSATGATYVTVTGRGGTTRRVRVRAGVSAGGLVEVVPVGGSVKAGDRVVVGG